MASHRNITEPFAWRSIKYGSVAPFDIATRLEIEDCCAVRIDPCSTGGTNPPLQYYVSVTWKRGISTGNERLFDSFDSEEVAKQWVEAAIWRRSALLNSWLNEPNLPWTPKIEGDSWQFYRVIVGKYEAIVRQRVSSNTFWDAYVMRRPDDDTTAGTTIWHGCYESLPVKTIAEIAEGMLCRQLHRDEMRQVSSRNDRLTSDWEAIEL